MKELLVNQDAFIEWYFDHDTYKTFLRDYSVIIALKSIGTFTITTQYLLENCGYLPENVAIEGQDLILNKDGEINLDSYNIFKLVKI